MEKIEIELKIPNLGEADDTEIIEISAKKGDKISKNDPIIVLESEKAAMEVPSDYDGIIKEITVKEGESVKEGKVFAVLETLSEAKIEDTAKEEIKPERLRNSNVDESREKSNSSKHEDLEGVYVGPAVKKIARELEINLKDIIGTGRNGIITKDDLKKYLHGKNNTKKSSYADLDDLKKFGNYKIINQSKISISGSNNLIESWSNVPHVTHFEEADISRLESERKSLNQISSVKITPLSYVIKAICLAINEHKIFNSSLIEKGKLMIKEYINIGIAVATDDGLVVPVIKDADKLNIGQLAEKIEILSSKARTKRLMKDDIEGATFTVSSLGYLGGTGFTPIINQPEVAIIGVSKSRTFQKNDEIIQILPFSLSYDHRVINGMDAGKFMVSLRNILEYKE